MGKGKIFDATLPITSRIVTYPGDPKVKIKKINSIEKDHFCLRQVSLSNHTGTHIDFPAHIIMKGKSSSDYPLSYFFGGGLVIELPKKIKSITKELVKKFSSQIKKGDIVFFKTDNSGLYKKRGFSKKFVFIETDAALELAKRKPKIIGIDYLSPDKYENDNLPIHYIFLSKNILIVEGLCLKGIFPGRYKKILIVPMNIPDMDALPVRVFLESAM